MENVFFYAANAKRSSRCILQSERKQKNFPALILRDVFLFFIQFLKKQEVFLYQLFKDNLLFSSRLKNVVLAV